MRTQSARAGCWLFCFASHQGRGGGAEKNPFSQKNRGCGIGWWMRDCASGIMPWMSAFSECRNKHTFDPHSSLFIQSNLFIRRKATATAVAKALTTPTKYLHHSKGWETMNTRKYAYFSNSFMSNGISHSTPKRFEKREEKKLDNDLHVIWSWIFLRSNKEDPSRKLAVRLCHCPQRGLLPPWSPSLGLAVFVGSSRERPGGYSMTFIWA